jgi:hypothetical protein
VLEKDIAHMFASETSARAKQGVAHSAGFASSTELSQINAPHLDDYRSRRLCRRRTQRACGRKRIASVTDISGPRLTDINDLIPNNRQVDVITEFGGLSWLV